MLISGGRHPFLARYKVGFTSTGKIMAADVELFSNGGCSLDLSGAVIEKAMFASDASYLIPHCRIRGKACRTNLPSNTGFRAFGTPQVCTQSDARHMSS
jgi:xanthine dehydrogenase/oxidase